MRMLDSLDFWQWIIQVMVIFFIVGGLVGITVGYGLFVNSSRTLAFIGRLNRWVSMRHVMKPLEIPRDTTAIAWKYMRVFAAFFIIGGLYSLYALATQFNPDTIIFSLGLGKVHPLISGSLIDAARWIMIVGNLAALAFGIMMVFFPNRVIALETRGGKWFSSRAMGQAGNHMHIPLDQWVAASPRAAGVIIAAGSLVVVVSLTFRLLALR